MTEGSFRERYERSTDNELRQFANVRRDLVPEAALALDHEIERRHLKPSTPHLLTNDSSLFGILIALVVMPFVILLMVHGRSELVYPVLVSSAAIASTIWSRWELKRYSWFWVTIGIFAVLHVLLILVVPWRAGWVPAPVTSFGCIVDLVIMLGIVGFIEKLNNKQLDGKLSGQA